MKSENPSNAECIRRFGSYRIIEHSVLIVLFLSLAITGLSQKFFYVGISQSVILILGGINNVRFFHHAAGVLFTALILQHILVAFAGVVLLRWQPSMLITFKDATDAMHNFRYYIGLVSSPAMCGRYTYKEKFIYWLSLLGGIQMVVTGIILWFPVAATKYFPGQFIPASKAVHSNEAMMIILLIVIWHIYNSIFSPEVFPFDKSIFTGYIKRGRMGKEHPAELSAFDAREEINKAAALVNRMKKKDD